MWQCCPSCIGSSPLDSTTIYQFAQDQQYMGQESWRPYTGSNDIPITIASWGIECIIGIETRDVAKGG